MPGNPLSLNPDVRSALEDAARAAGELFSIDLSVIYLQNYDGSLASASWYGCEPQDTAIRIEENFLPTFRRGRESVLHISLGVCPISGLESIPEQLDIQTGLVAPLLNQDALVGLWLIGFRSGREFQTKEELLFHILVDNLSLAIRGMSLAEDNLRFRREADALYEISTEISQHLDLNRVLEAIVKKTSELLHAEISYLALADEDEKVIRVRITHGTRGDALSRLMHRYGEGFGGRVAVTRKPLLVNNYSKDTFPKPPGIPDLLAKEGIVSAICVPMVSHRGLVGVLYAASRIEGAFKPFQLDLLQALGAQAAIAIENARLYDEQKAIAQKLQNSITVHQRFLNLILGNQGYQAIADTLSELIACPIVVEDDHFQVLCYSTNGCDLSSPSMLADQYTSTAGLWRNPELKEYLNVLSGTVHSVRIPPVTGQENRFARVIAPIVGGRQTLGYVSAFEVLNPLNEQQQTALEQASIVLALEFMKLEAARRTLLHRVISAQEDERKRIARELHDETSQAITAMMVGLDTVSLALLVSPQEAAERLSATKTIAETMLENIHRLISDLRPSLLDDLGLVAAIAWYGEQRLKPSGITLQMDTVGFDRRLPAAVETALFRIVQEAITNIIRHAKATAAIVRLRVEGNDLILQVEDDGCGFDPQVLQSSELLNHNVGLWGMHERMSILDGKFSVKSKPGMGTLVSISVPISKGN